MAKKLTLGTPTELTQLPIGEWFNQRKVAEYMTYDRYWPSATKLVNALNTLTFKGEKYVKAEDVKGCMTEEMFREVSSEVTQYLNVA